MINPNELKGKHIKTVGVFLMRELQHGYVWWNEDHYEPSISKQDLYAWIEMMTRLVNKTLINKRNASRIKVCFFKTKGALIRFYYRRKLKRKMDRFWKGFEKGALVKHESNDSSSE